jgi:hypothetical protein
MPNPDCQEPTYARGWCRRHYDRWRLEQRPCTVEGCAKPAWSAGLCKTHYRFHLGRHSGSENSARTPNKQRSDYDQRLVSLFLNELEHSGFPCFPDTRWHWALARADFAFRYSTSRTPPEERENRPGTGHRALPRRVAGVPEHWQFLRSVNQACTRWLSARDG